MRPFNFPEYTSVMFLKLLAPRTALDTWPYTVGQFFQNSTTSIYAKLQADTICKTMNVFFLDKNENFEWGLGIILPVRYGAAVCFLLISSINFSLVWRSTLKDNTDGVCLLMARIMFYILKGYFWNKLFLGLFQS